MERYNEDIQNKNVRNISATQDRLIIGLTNSIQKNKTYVLDGHYCLINNENEIENIPLDTFKLINPFSFIIILGDIIEIKKRLEKRDNLPYNQELLSLMQESELKHAMFLSNTMGVTLNIGTQNDLSELLISLRDLMRSHK